MTSVFSGTWRVGFRCDINSPVACDERRGHRDGIVETVDQIITGCEWAAFRDDSIGTRYWTRKGGYNNERPVVRDMTIFVCEVACDDERGVRCEHS